MTNSTGYSGTPLWKKLGIGEGAVVAALNAPINYRELVAPLPMDAIILNKAAPNAAFVHLFATERAHLKSELARLRPLLKPNGVIWVSWPKKASKVSTDITEDAIREIAFPLGLVDIKVCAVDQTWSGLKLMIRKELR